MALYRAASLADTTGKVKEVYEDIMATKKIDFDLDQCIACPKRILCSYDLKNTNGFERREYNEASQSLRRK